jgi:hypothetical protein
VRKVVALLAAVIFACGLTLATSSPASATGAWLGCRISPGTVFTWSQYCSNSKSASWYNAAFLVQNAPTPLSYTWSVPAGYSIYAYCGSSDNSCAVVTHPGDEIVVTVTLNYSDHSESYWADATLDPGTGDPYCGGQPC